MRRVLFVDDDEDMLIALARAVSRGTRRCLAQFAASGELALAALQQAPFDIIVTDWHMPRMNGGQLLERVKIDYPQMIRVILSSHPELAAARWDTLAHRCLRKPCDGRQLEDVIARACELHIR